MALEKADSPSPLQVDEDGMAIALARSGSTGAMATTPVALSRVAPLHDSPARTSQGSWLHAKQAQESAIITAVRRQLEALDDKLSTQLSHEIARVQQEGDRQREMAIAAVQAKVAAVEALQPKFDRRLAELGGCTKGLSEEMQAQIRRVDQMDSRLWEWRHQLDDDLRTKLTELEQSHQQVCTSVRVAKASTDDVLKRYTVRLVRLEEMLEERSAHAEDLGHSLMSLHGRLLQVEEDPGSRGKQQHQVVPVQQDSERVLDAGKHHQAADHQQKLEVLQQESSDLRVQVESLEERFKTLRTLYDAQDEQYRGMRDHFERGNWEGRIKDLHSRMHSCEQLRVGHAEQIDILHQKLTLQEHGLVHRRVPQEPAGTESPGLSNGRLDQAEARIGALGDELETIRADLELVPRVSALVAALKDVAPKVITHEEAVAEMQAQLQDILARHARLEADVQRISASAAEMAAAAGSSPIAVEGTTTGDGATTAGEGALGGGSDTPAGDEATPAAEDSAEVTS